MQIRIQSNRSVSSLLAALGCVWLCVPVSLAIDIQGVLPASADQPSINAILQPLAGGNPYMFDLGGGLRTFNIPAFLDTGTSGIVISSSTASLWEVPLAPGVTFGDTAVGGTSNFGVTKALNIRVAPSYAQDVDNLATFNTVYNQVYPNARIQAGPSNSDPDQLSFDVFGMPLLMGKTMVSDARGLNDGTDLLRTYIYDPNHPQATPGVPATSHHVALSYGDFSSFTSLSPGNADPPAFAHNPFIGPNPLAPAGAAGQGAQPQVVPSDPPGISISYGGFHTGGSFLFDSGAQVSFISTNLANNLHVHYRDFGTNHPQLIDDQGTPIPHQFLVPVQGISGIVTVAGFYLDDLVLHTIEGSANDADPNNLRYVLAPVAVLDITIENRKTGEFVTLDGDFGTNFLFASQLETGFGETVSGPYNFVTFDEPNGILGLDVIGIPEPSSFVLSAFALIGLAVWGWRRKR
jgi:hypothetical protein